MDKFEYLKERQKGIGGSDVGAIMGVNKYKSAFEVYFEKTEEIRNYENYEVNKALKNTSEAAYWGETLKELVAKEFSLRTGKKVRKDNKYLIDENYEFMIGHIDRKVVGENSILMCKTANAFLSKEWDEDKVPQSYLLQCQHYMQVYNANKCYIAALIGGQKFVFKEIMRDEELISMIIEAEKDFWINHVKKRIPPVIDGSEHAKKYLNEKFKDVVDTTLEVILKEEDKTILEEYLKLKEEIRILDESLKSIENNLKNEIGHAERGISDKFLVNWKGILSRKIDITALKNKYPEVYKEVCRQSKSRRFEIHEIENRK